MINAFISTVFFIEDISKNQEDWKKRIKAEFRETVNLPRKKKKQKRKELNLEWAIANWNPFEY
jgi:hypothetical protein